MFITYNKSWHKWIYSVKVLNVNGNYNFKRFLQSTRLTYIFGNREHDYG